MPHETDNKWILEICRGEAKENELLDWDWIPETSKYQHNFTTIFSNACEHFIEPLVSCALLQRFDFKLLTDTGTRCAQLTVYFTLEKLMKVHGVLVDIYENDDKDEDKDVLKKLGTTSRESWNSWIGRTRNSGIFSPASWHTYVHRKIYGIYLNKKRAKLAVEGVVVDGNLTIERKPEGYDTKSLSQKDREHRKKHGTIQSPISVGQAATNELETHVYVNVFVRQELEKEAKGILDDIKKLLFQRAHALDPTHPNAALRDRQLQLFNMLASPEFIERVSTGKQVMREEVSEELAQRLGIHKGRLGAEWGYLKTWLKRFLRGNEGEELKQRVLEVVNYDVINDRRLEDPWETTYLPSVFEQEELTHEG